MAEVVLGNQWYRVTVDGVPHTVFVEQTAPPPPPLPAAPTGLRVSSVTTTTVSLDWNDSTDLRAGDQYQVYVNDVLVVPDLTASAYTVTGLTAGTAYQFRVSAGKSGSYSSLSAAVPGTTTTATPPPTGPPAPPTGLAVVSVTTTTVSLNWNDSPDLRSGDKYQIYVNDNWAGQAESTVSQYTVTGLSAGLTYQFRVSAGKAGSYGDWSNPSVSGTTAGTTPPPTGGAVNRPANPLLMAFGDTNVPTTAVKNAWAKPGALVVTGRYNYALQWVKDVAAAGATVITYLHPHLINTFGRYAEKLYLASEFGPAVPDWPGGPFVVDEWGTLADFRVGSLCNTKLQGVLNLMLDENPHISGFFFDGLGTRAYPGAGGFSWDAFPMKTEYRNGAIAQAQIARNICNARNAMCIGNGIWQAGSGNGGGYPNIDAHGCSLLDGAMMENRPPAGPGHFAYEYAAGASAQWGLAVPRIAAMPKPQGYIISTNSTAADRDSWVALGAVSHAQSPWENMSDIIAPWKTTFTDFKMPNRKTT